jgi:HD superfamily phosphohydrolase
LIPTTRAAIIRHLDEEYTEPVRDPVWGSIPLSAGHLRLMEQDAVQRMHRIKQLGPTYLVYPGATHTRFSHSLGVFHIARRIMRSLLRNEWPSGSFGLSAEAVRAFLCAALLHDLGHYPFAHSLKDLDVEEHESLTARRVLSGGMSASIRRDIGVDPGLVAAIVDQSRAYGGGDADAPTLAFLRGILSCVLDPDKLDYLNRDAYFCGVPYGIQDVDFVLGEIGAIPGVGLGVTRKGLTAVENVLFSKYLMHRSVYRHKTVRVATAMVKKALVLGLHEGVLAQEQLYWTDDAGFLGVLDASKFGPFALADAVTGRRLYRVACSVPFDATLEAHRRMEHPAQRLEVEEEIAREVGRILGRQVRGEEIIIDVPESLSFDLGLPVLDGLPSGTSGEAGEAPPSVFEPGVIAGFARALRPMALMVPRDDALAAAASGAFRERVRA